ncbi:MAG: DUF1844 domain-containing protein [Polyangiaceae bacterium]
MTEKAKSGSAKASEGKHDEHHVDPLPSIDFSTFVLSLSHSALMHLGEAPHPDTNAVEKSIPLARQTIDLISLLEEKTKGNLSGDEERLIHQILFDLRMRFVELSKT